jgi:hypothetical protein
MVQAIADLILFPKQGFIAMLPPQVGPDGLQDAELAVPFDPVQLRPTPLRPVYAHRPVEGGTGIITKIEKSGVLCHQ